MTRDEIVLVYTRRLSQTLTTVEPKEYWAVQSVLTAAIRDADLEARQELDAVVRKQAIGLKAYEEEAIALVRRINHEKDRRSAALEEMVGLNQVISNLQAQNAKLANENEEMRRNLELRALAIPDSTPSPLSDREMEWVIDNLRFRNNALRAEMKEIKLAAAYDEAVIEDARLAAVATIENQRESIKNLKANLVNRGHDIDRLREIKSEDEQAIATLRATVAALRENLDRTTKERDFAQMCLQESDGRVAALSKELDEESLLRGQLAACRREVNALSSQLIEAHEKHAQDRKHLHAGLESCEAELNRVKAANQALTDQIDTAKGWRHKLQIEHDHELARAVVTFEGQIHELVKERDALAAKLSAETKAFAAASRAAESLLLQVGNLIKQHPNLLTELAAAEEGRP